MKIVHILMISIWMVVCQDLINFETNSNSEMALTLLDKQWDAPPQNSKLKVKMCETYLGKYVIFSEY